MDSEFNLIRNYNHNCNAKQPEVGDAHRSCRITSDAEKEHASRDSLAYFTGRFSIRRLLLACECIGRPRPQGHPPVFPHTKAIRSARFYLLPNGKIFFQSFFMSTTAQSSEAAASRALSNWPTDDCRS
jgi:hypothetical protein